MMEIFCLKRKGLDRTDKTGQEKDRKRPSNALQCNAVPCDAMQLIARESLSLSRIRGSAAAKAPHVYLHQHHLRHSSPYFVYHT
jgi:hypothetical protein